MLKCLQAYKLRNTTCRATLTFENATFLPLFLIASPENCAGDQVARFQVRQSAPKGAAAYHVVSVEIKRTHQCIILTPATRDCSGVDGTAVDLMANSDGSSDADKHFIDSEATLSQ
jgi:hypothetical protein